MKNNFEHASGEKKEAQLPGVERMRSDVAAFEARFHATMKKKLFEYTGLYNRFTAGDELSQEDTIRMAELSKELEKLSQHLQSPE